MLMYAAASMLAVGLAAQASAPERPAPQVAENWAAPLPPAPDRKVIERAVRDTIEDEKALARAAATQAAIPRRYTASSVPDMDKYEKFEVMFDEARVPDCLRPDGLKRQSTLIFSGLLAIPFVAVAKIRGKCN